MRQVCPKRRRVYVIPKGIRSSFAAFFQAPLPLTMARSSLKRCTDSGDAWCSPPHHLLKTLTLSSIEASAAMGVIDLLLSDNPSWDKEVDRQPCREDSTQGDGQ